MGFLILMASVNFVYHEQIDLCCVDMICSGKSEAIDSTSCRNSTNASLSSSHKRHEDSQSIASEPLTQSLLHRGASGYHPVSAWLRVTWLKVRKASVCQF